MKILRAFVQTSSQEENKFISQTTAIGLYSRTVKILKASLNVFAYIAGYKVSILLIGSYVFRFQGTITDSVSGKEKGLIYKDHVFRNGCFFHNVLQCTKSSQQTSHYTAEVT